MKSKISVPSGQPEAGKIVPLSAKKTIVGSLEQNPSQDAQGIDKKTENRIPIGIASEERTRFKHVWPTTNSQRYQSNQENGEIYEKRILLTPNLANTWRQSTLAVEARTGHRLNRSASLKRIATMARMMQNEHWPYVGDTIKLSPPDRETGEPIIVDGWHRICATIKADRAIEFLVIFNLPHELFPYIDIGRNRNAADLLVVNGFISQKFLASAARIVWYLERQEANLQTVVTNPEILANVDRHKHLVRTVTEIREADKPFQSSVIAAACYWLERTKDPRANEFIQGLLKGEGTFPIGSPIKALRRRILNDPELKSGWSGKNRGQLLSFMFQAWEYFLQGQKIDRLRSDNTFNWPAGAPYLKTK